MSWALYCIPGLQREYVRFSDSRAKRNVVETNVSYSQLRGLFLGKEKKEADPPPFVSYCVGFSQQPYKVYVREERATQRG